MKVEIAGNDLMITLPLADPPVPSTSGKSLTVASTRGNVQTSVLVQGKPVTVGVNAYITRSSTAVHLHKQSEIASQAMRSLPPTTPSQRDMDR